MSPKSNRINLKYDPFLLKSIFDRASCNSHFCYIFSVRTKVQNVLGVKNFSFFSFFNVCYKEKVGCHYQSFYLLIVLQIHASIITL